MDLISHLPKSLIFLDVEAEDKWSLLRDIVDRICSSSEFQRLGVSSGAVLEGVMQRERTMSTGIGKGLAFPHIRHPELQTMLISLVRLKNAISFDAVDDLPVEVLCMVLAPDQEPTIALKVRSRLVKLLSGTRFRQQLTLAQSPEAVSKLMREQHVDLDVPITAQDIMRTSVLRANAQTPLKQVTRMMSDNHTNALAVVDDDNCIVGEITCADLFGFGMPDFFSQLQSVSFISEFDPFEKYFHQEAHSVASNIMSGDFLKMGLEASLLELVFGLTVLDHNKVYIEDDGELVGEVDQALVLDEIMGL